MDFLAIKNIGKGLYDHIPYVPKSLKKVVQTSADVAYKFCATLIHPISSEGDSSADHISFPVISAIAQHHFSSQANAASPIELYEGWNPSYEGLTANFKEWTHNYKKWIPSFFSSINSKAITAFSSNSNTYTCPASDNSEAVASLSTDPWKNLEMGLGSFLFSSMVSFEENGTRQSFLNYKKYLKNKLGPSAAHLSKECLKFAERNVENNSVNLNLKYFVKTDFFDPEMAVMEQISYIEGVLKQTSPQEFLYILWEINEFIEDYIEAKQYIEERKFEDLSLNTVREERKAWIEGFAGKWHFIVPEDPKEYEKALDTYLNTVFSKLGKIIYGANVHIPFRNLMHSMALISLKMGFQPYYFKKALKILKEMDDKEFLYIKLFEVLERYTAKFKSFKKIKEFEQPSHHFPENLILIDFIGGTQIVRACSEKARSFGIKPGIEAYKAQYLYDSKSNDGSLADLKYRNKNPELFKGYYSLEDLFGKLIKVAPKYLFLSLRKKLLERPLIGIPLLITFHVAYLLSWPLRKLTTTALSNIPTLEEFGRDFASNFLFMLRFPGLKILGVRVIESFLNCFAHKEEKVQYEPFPIENPKHIYLKTFRTLHKLALSFFPKISKINQNIFIKYSIKTSFWTLRQCTMLTIKLIDSPLGYLALKVIKQFLFIISRMPLIGDAEFIDKNHDFIEDGFVFLKKTCRVLNTDGKTDIEKLRDSIVLFFEEAAKHGLVNPDIRDLKESSDPIELFQETQFLLLKMGAEYFNPQTLSWNESRIALKKKYLQEKQEISKTKQRINCLSAKIKKLKKKIAKYEPGAFHYELIKDFLPIRDVEASIKKELAYLTNKMKKNRALKLKYEELFHKLIFRNDEIGNFDKWFELIEERISVCQEIQDNNHFQLKDQQVQHQLDQLLHLKKLLKLVCLCQKGDNLIKKAEEKGFNMRDVIAHIKGRLGTKPKNEKFADNSLEEDFTHLLKGVEETSGMDRFVMVDFLLSSEGQIQRAEAYAFVTLRIRSWSKDLRAYYHEKLKGLKEKEDEDRLLSDNLKTFLLPKSFFKSDLTQNQQIYFRNFLNQFNIQELNNNILFAAKKRLEEDFNLYPNEKAKTIEGRLAKTKEEFEKIKKENKLYFATILKQDNLKQELKEYLKDNRSLIRKLYDCAFNFDFTFLHEATYLDSKEKEKDLFIKGINFLKQKHPNLVKSRLENENKLKWLIFDLSVELLDLENQGMSLNHFNIPWWLSLTGQEAFDQLLPRAVYYAKKNKPFGLFL